MSILEYVEGSLKKTKEMLADCGFWEIQRKAKLTGMKIAFAQIFEEALVNPVVDHQSLINKLQGDLVRCVHERDMVYHEMKDLEEHRDIYNMNRKQLNESTNKLFDENKTLKNRLILLERIISMIRTCADTHCEKCPPMTKALEEIKVDG